MEIKVMTFNIRHGLGMDRRINIGRIAKAIKLANPDIVGLNEVDRHFSSRSYFKDQLFELADLLEMSSAFGPAITVKIPFMSGRGQYGNALLSRYPILSREVIPFNFIKGVFEGRSLLQTAIQIDEKVVRVCVTHLSFNPFLRKIQTDFIAQRMFGNTFPSIVMGDFNMLPGSGNWRKITEKSTDAWQAAGTGSGLTFPSVRPRLTLDYIFTKGVEVTGAAVVSDMREASDHLPLTAYIRL
ncbi:endonuclease/exonuclease/phosphatase family protein [Salipaludibacillus aurantiacus]|uniref:endonuclease/exonuclease/phosphatase family protein n=1 Tax=Salipaludibacillus aurantiacus TaxID=1601833 RepID=UPI000B836285|nr:endonuclease/exonuclease/phosphatase family protein [Salipaludibacillus aurantiacus]